MPLSPEQNARLAVERETHLTKWFAQDDWASPAAVALMKAVLANDEQEIRAWIGQVDVTVPPPGYQTQADLLHLPFQDALTLQEGTSWLIHAVHAKATHAIGPMIQAGANPVEPDPTEDRSCALFHAFNAVDPVASDLRKAFYRALPTLDASLPADEQGYGPLAMVLCHTTPVAIVREDGSDSAYTPVLQAMRELLARGGQWNDATREAVFHGAILCGRPVLLDELAQAGLHLKDVPVAGQQALLMDALNLHAIYDGYHAKGSPENADRGWLNLFARHQVELPAQALARLSEARFGEAVSAYAQHREAAGLTLTREAHPASARRPRGPGR